MNDKKSSRNVSRPALIAVFLAVCMASAPAPAIAGPSCDSVFPLAMIQSTYAGKAVRALPNQPAHGALLLNCAYRVSGSGTVSLKLFNAALESPQATTVAQMGKEGYKCLPIDGTVGFPASSCELTRGSMGISSIVFTTTNKAYAAILTDAAAITGASALAPLYSIAKSVDSNAAAH
jgi:hypothetical protein